MKSYVLAGASSRAYVMFAKPLSEKYADTSAICGIYDANHLRAELFAADFGNIRVFDDFDAMLRETKPDCVIVTTVDAYHHEYIIRSLEAGCDVITEKPMATDAAKCRAILEAERRTGRKVTVTFNYRFVPYVTKIKEIMRSGAVGKVLSVDFEWFLDRNMAVSAHGTSYFRRWNRYMAKSGGLLVHKATHHFDMVNWWLEDRPKEVFAFGDLKVYGRNGEFRGENCRRCLYTGQCPYYIDIGKDKFSEKLFTPAEHMDGYNKDGCVFDQGIDIYDTMSLNVRYAGGALMNYSLIAHAPYEGWRISLNGDKGRIEAGEAQSGMLRRGLKTQKIKLFGEDDTLCAFEIPVDEAGHGGGDPRLQKMLFEDDVPDPLGHMAGSEAGAASAMTGICANVSIKEKRPVNISEMME